jgi:hypothetical protein
VTSPSRRPHRSLAVAGLALLVPLVAACGFNAQTDQVYQAATGANDRSGTVDVLNAMIVSDSDGSGTFAGALVNTASDDDSLVGVTDATGTVDVPVPAGDAVNLAASGEVRVRAADITPGAFVSLTLQFSSGQTTTLAVPVVPHEGDYVDVPVGPTATPSAKHKKHRKATSEESSTASPGASPSATPTE